MTTYAVAREVPEDCTYLTAGKRYEVIKAMDFSFRLILDNGDSSYAIWKKCSHLDFKGWHRIETDAEGWAEWKPSKYGEAPLDWQDSWEWEYTYSVGSPFAKPADDTAPIWGTDTTYRYRPRAISETAQVEPAQVECDHPNADDYRNRAERAEAESAELALRIRKLEALVCDALLEGDV